MSEIKPIYVFIPGAFQGPPHFEPIVEALTSHGLEAIALALPGIGKDAGTAPPLESVKYIRSKLEELVVDSKREVVLVGCSYGGFVASMSVKGLQRVAQAQKGLSGGVIRTVFISALVIPEDATMVASLGGGLPPWAELGEKEGVLNPAPTCAGLFFSDLDESAQRHWATFFQPTTPRDSMATVKDSCWDIDIPKTYIFTTKDNTSLLAHQKAMVEQVATSRPDDWSYEHMDSDHSPFLSHVEETAALLGKYAA